MQLLFNGEMTQVNLTPAADTANLSQVLTALGLLDEGVADFVVAHNQSLVNKAQYASTLLTSGDQLDVLSVITGG